MPIRINLLAESLAEEDLRRRDPVKRSIIIGALLVAISLVWFSSNWLESLMANGRLNQVDSQIQSDTTDYNAVVANQKKTADLQRRIDSLQMLNATRFLQGNLLEALQKIYVPNVQVMRIKLDQTYAPSPSNKTGSMVEHISLTMDGRDSSPAGDQWNHYRDALAAQTFFKSQLSLTNGVRLANLSPPQTSADGKPFVIFTLECRFQDKTR